MSATGTRVSFSHENQTKATKEVVKLLKENGETPTRELIQKHFFAIQNKANLAIPQDKWDNVAKWLVPNINLVFQEIIENKELKKQLANLQNELQKAHEKLDAKADELANLKATTVKSKKLTLYIAGLLPKQQQLLIQNNELSNKCIFKFASSEQHNNTQLESAMINSDYVLLMTDFINRNTVVKKFKAKLINVNGGITNLEETITKLLNKK